MRRSSTPSTSPEPLALQTTPLRLPTTTLGLGATLLRLPTTTLGLDATPLRLPTTTLGLGATLGLLRAPLLLQAALSLQTATLL